MKNAMIWVCGALVLAAAVVSFGAGRSSAETKKFNNVVPFAEYGGLTGFFDQDTGKIYMYDMYIHKCLRVLQVDELGKDINEVEKVTNY